MTRTRRLLTATIAACLCVVPLVGCAPEPGTVAPDGKPLTEKQEPDGESWPEKAPDEAFEKHQEVPADFPAAFVIPEGATIHDVGARGAGVWFLVLRAGDATAGDSLWSAVIDAGGFTASEGEAPVEGGKSASLTSATLAVDATMFPDGDNGVLLSYDITQTVM